MTDTQTHRPRRSVLYMPGSKQRALEKATGLPADALILDLEDAVAPDEKPAARDLVMAAVKDAPYGPREVIVRINGLDTEWGRADLEAAATAAPDAILVPKVESASMIAEVEAALDAAGTPASTTIWAMMETPRAMLRAAEIADASPRLACLVMGTNDLVKEIDAEHTPAREPVLAALGLCVLAAKAAGTAIVDGVYNAFKDDEGLRASCEQGRAMGFDGKTLIHPAQIAAANGAFAPTPDDVERARRTVAAHQAALAEGKGVAVLDGRIVEALHVDTARRTLTRAEAIEALEAAP